LWQEDKVALTGAATVAGINCYRCALSEQCKLAVGSGIRADGGDAREHEARRGVRHGIGMEGGRRRILSLAMKVRKGRGDVRLGNPSNAREAGEIGRVMLGAAADHARRMLPLLRTIRAEGTITRSLNERKIATARG
jgi:hypothetical protein